MKKLFLLMFIGFALISLACRVSGPNDTSGVPAHPPGSMGAATIKYPQLPVDSAYVCTFSVNFSNEGVGWPESNEFTEGDSGKGRVGTKFLVNGTLSTKDGWSWNYLSEDGNRPEGYFCQKNK